MLNYFADMAWSINGGIIGKMVLPKYPRYHELTSPGQVRKDSAHGKSGKQILEDLIAHGQKKCS